MLIATIKLLKKGLNFSFRLLYGVINNKEGL